MFAHSGNLLLAHSPIYDVVFLAVSIGSSVPESTRSKPVQHWPIARSFHERRAVASGVPVALRCAALAYVRGVEARLALTGRQSPEHGIRSFPKLQPRSGFRPERACKRSDGGIAVAVVFGILSAYVPRTADAFCASRRPERLRLNAVLQTARFPRYCYPLFGSKSVLTI